MTISSPGLGSGLDVNGIISKLMTIEQQPLVNLTQKEASYQAQLSAYGNLKSALSTFQSAVKTLDNASLFTGVKASVVDTSLATVSATSKATVGSHQIEVQALAQAQKIKSESIPSVTDTIGSGTLTIEFGTYNGDGSFTSNPKTLPKTVTIGSDQSTLSGIRDSINKANIGITASIVNEGSGNRLVIASNETGLSYALKITASDDDGNNTNNAGLSKLVYDASTGGTSNMSETVAAKDATIVLDGISISKPSNTIKDALDGVTINLLTAKVGTATSLTVAQDVTSIQTAVGTLVTSYNELQKTITSVSNYDKDTKQASILTGDSTVRAIQTQLRNALGSILPDRAVGELNSLSQVGVTFQKDGTLTVDSSKLTAALADPTKNVAGLFSNNGLATKLNKVVTDMLQNNGLLDGRMDGITASIKTLGKDQEMLTNRLQDVETRYRAQFTALDTMIASMNQTSSFLTQQLAKLPGFSSN